MDLRTLGNGVALGVFVVLVAGAALFGAQFPPGEWYENLEKAPWTPPNWLFGPVWTLLYLAIAIAGWLVWKERRSAGFSPALALWVVQLLLNAAWSWLFFGRHQIGLAALDITALAIAILAFIAVSAPVSRPAAALFAPYAAWVLYAMSLNLYAWWRN